MMHDCRRHYGYHPSAMYLHRLGFHSAYFFHKFLSFFESTYRFPLPILYRLPSPVRRLDYYSNLLHRNLARSPLRLRFRRRPADFQSYQQRVYLSLHVHRLLQNLDGCFVGQKPKPKHKKLIRTHTEI